MVLAYCKSLANGNQLQSSHHGVLVESDCDVVEALEDGLVVFLHHLLQQLDVLEDGQPELGHALHVLLAYFLLLLLL